MKLLTRTRYGVRCMLFLARHYDQGPVFLKDLARQEEISEKYLSLIVIPLRARGLISSVRGARGGYLLARPPSRITIGEIVAALEGENLVACTRDASVCARADACTSRNIWVLLDERIAETLNAITLEQALETCVSDS